MRQWRRIAHMAAPVQLVYSSVREKMAYDLTFAPLLYAQPPVLTLAPAHAVAASFEPPRYLAALRTRSLGRVLLVSPRVASTQSFVDAHLRAHRSILLVADEQAAGKGRGANTWSSPQGCLMFTFVSEHTSGATLPHVQYLVALAIHRAVTGLCGEIGLALKWPNDLYDGRAAKVGGILCQSSYDGRAFTILTGVGLNVTNAEPTSCLRAMAQRVNGDSDLRREPLLAAIMNEYEALHDSLEASTRGFAPFEAEYYAHWLHTEQELTLHEDGQERRVVIKGLAPSGYLLAVDETGATVELQPDATSLNLWENLVSRKK